MNLEVNKYKLDTECEQQPALYLEQAEKLATAKGDRDEMDNRLKFVLAEREQFIRGAYKDQKLTEAGVKALLETDPEVLGARENLVKAEKTVYYLEAVVKAYEHRKASLDNLVVLFSKGYYSRPDGGKMSAEDVAQKDIRKNLNKEN